MKVLFIVFVLFGVLVAIPVAAKPSVSSGDFYISHLAGPGGEGVDIRLPGVRVPSGLNDDRPQDFLPTVKLHLIVDDGEGNNVATIDDIPYPLAGLTLRFTTGDTGGEYAELLVNDLPSGGSLPVGANGRVEYTAEMIIVVTPYIVQGEEEEESQNVSPGKPVESGNPVGFVVHSLATGATVATGYVVKFKAGKALKESLN